MGLYLTVFDADEELDGVEVGSYADFHTFRSVVVDKVEGGRAGSSCPTLIIHSDCDGGWSPQEARILRSELDLVAKRFRQLPPMPLEGDWKAAVAEQAGIQPASLYDCFFDIDGEPLLERLSDLAILSHERDLPILFQ